MEEEGKAAVVPFLAKGASTQGQKLPMNYPIVIRNDDVPTSSRCSVIPPTS